MNWIKAVAECELQNQSFVLITVIQTQGSTPRDTTAKMVITDTQRFDSIGGGQLEFSAIETAQRLIKDHKVCTLTETFNLAKDLEQCCGGKVSLLFECFPASEFNIVVLGAGHVGKAVITLLSELFCRVIWLDSRELCFSDDLPVHILPTQLNNAEQAISACPPDSWYLVMSHSHILDQQLVEAILSRGDVRFCGLIGSASKAASFRSRLKRKGFTEKELLNLTSPIGLAELKGKQPMEIAISVVAQMMILREAAANS